MWEKNGAGKTEKGRKIEEIQITLKERTRGNTNNIKRTKYRKYK